MSDKIIERIAKLLALQEARGASEAEASLAAEHVTRLLQEHNLTLAQVEAQAGTANEGKREKQLTERSAMYAYQQNLMRALAEANFCLHVIRKRVWTPDTGWGKETRLVDGQRVTGHLETRHLLVGRALNVQVTQQTYDYLIVALKRAAQEAGFPPNRLTRELFYFYEGCVSRLAERLEERRRERKRESEASSVARAGNGTGKELVLSDVYGSEADLNNDALNGFPPGTTAAERRKNEERRVQREAKEAELVAAGVDQTEAFYQSYGYSVERAAEAAKEFNRRSRRRGGRGRARNWTRGDAEHYRKVNSTQYKAGRTAGSAIGLDDQVGGGSSKRLGRA